ncbi:hypothetical protein DICVIV_09869 [Dictyocaulus viviparus]|uniref:Uncharacterized protein n=1 Tax=Dictyocaulus viviparus TaxID=29172 RepID=A0A0D8XJT6_DICVI|nr:hypothetical protein DICVIV_09869 [Dictyocaulus viviparus]
MAFKNLAKNYVVEVKSAHLPLHENTSKESVTYSSKKYLALEQECEKNEEFERSVTNLLTKTCRILRIIREDHPRQGKVCPFAAPRKYFQRKCYLFKQKYLALEQECEKNEEFERSVTNLLTKLATFFESYVKIITDKKQTISTSRNRTEELYNFLDDKQKAIAFLIIQMYSSAMKNPALSAKQYSTAAEVFFTLT